MAFVKWLGHSSFQAELAGKRILFDPWFQEPAQRLVRPHALQDEVRRADLIFVSHEHFDHCSPLDVNPIVERTSAQVVATLQSLAMLDIPSRSKVSAEAGDSFYMHGIGIEVVPASHRSGNPVGFIISAEGKKLYFAGDTYDYYGMSDFQVDLALLPIGGKYTMDAIGAVKALKMMRAKQAVPMHYGTFAEINADPADFARRAAAGTKTAPIVLEVGAGLHF